MRSPKIERDPLGRAFALITAELEDAVEVAVVGQDRTLSLRDRRGLLRRLTRHFARCEVIMVSIAGLLDEARR